MKLLYALLGLTSASLAMGATVTKYVDAKAGFYRHMSSSDVIGGVTWGQVLTKGGEPIYKRDADSTKTSTVEISNDQDFVSYVYKFGKVFTITQFESPLPGEYYLARSSQDATTGKLTSEKFVRVDFSSSEGVWIPCAGSVTPWNTHLGSEEYEPDARKFEAASTLSAVNGDILEFMRYYGVYNGTEGWTIENIKDKFNPYMYGYINEVTVTNAEGAHTAVKHMTMGRLAMELSKCVDHPTKDQTVCYTTDDGRAVTFARFVSAKKGDLSSGTLYVPKVTQNKAFGSQPNVTDFTLTWISAGSATNAEILTAAKTLKFSDIWETEAPVNNACPTAGFKPVNQGGQGLECLKLKAGQDKVASRLETRRYAGYVGATTEFNKWEGITYHAETNAWYTAMSSIGDAMLNNKTKHDYGMTQQVALAENRCGCVYKMECDADLTILNMKPLICGNIDSNVDPNVKAGSGCSLDSIANPDNVAAYSNILLIGEDTSAHQNDMVWAYDLVNNTMVRIATTPYGAETTGVYFHFLNGFTYLHISTQHPFGESDTDKKQSSNDLNGYQSYWVFKSAPANAIYSFGSISAASTDAEKRETRGTASLSYGVLQTTNTTKSSASKAAASVLAVAMLVMAVVAF